MANENNPSEEAPKGKSPIDFVKVDILRKHMLLTVIQFAELLGVSRITYYSWLKDKYPRKKKEEAVRKTLKQLFFCIRVKNWPTPNVLVASQDDRIIMLRELLTAIEREVEQV